MPLTFENSFSNIISALSEGLKITLKYWKLCIPLGILLILSSFSIITSDPSSFLKELSDMELKGSETGSSYTMSSFWFAKASMLTVSIWTPCLAEGGAGFTYLTTYPFIANIWGRGESNISSAICSYLLKSFVHILIYFFLLQILLKHKTQKIEFPSFKKIFSFLKYILFLPILFILFEALLAPFNFLTFGCASFFLIPLMLILTQTLLLFSLPLLLEEKMGVFKSFLISALTVLRNNLVLFVCFYFLLIFIGSASHLLPQFHSFPHQEWLNKLGIIVMCFTAPWSMMTCLCMYDKIFNLNRENFSK